MPTPGVIEYPAALDTPLSLIELLNNASSTLTANISVGDLLIPVADPGKFSTSGFATLTDSLTAPTKIEVFIYTSKSGSNLVVPPSIGRGAQGTTAQAFSTGNFVEQRPTARHHTVLADLLLAIEAKLGIGADTPGAAVEALLSNGAGASLWRAIAQGDISGLVTALADKVSKSDVALQTIISDLIINKASPGITFIDTVPNPDHNVALLLSGGTFRLNNNTGSFEVLNVSISTSVVTFNAIPSLPAINPTTDNQAVRKKFVDDKVVPFSLCFRIDDPSTFPINDETALPLLRVPAVVGGGAFITKIVIIRAGAIGHAAGGSVTFAARIFNSGTVGSGVAFSDTNNLPTTPYSEDFADQAIAEGNFITVLLTARSGTIAERNVSINIEGYQKVKSL